MGGYNRINRSHLLFDSNMVEKGSLNETVVSPSNGKLLNRIGLDTESDPLPKYCLHFNKSNPQCSIKTTIPSSQRDNYNIIIKGEGSIDLLVVDSSGENIAIRPKYIITSPSTSYFILSYIAFMNITTKKIEHLFECEESSGLILYDAISGETATLENVASISALRTTNNRKEYFKDHDNLENTIRFGEVGYSRQGRVDTPIKTLPSIFSIALRVKFPCTWEEYYATTSNQTIFYKSTDVSDVSDVDDYIHLSIRPTLNDFALVYKTKNMSSLKTINLLFDGTKVKALFDKKYHNIVITFGQSAVKMYIDGIIIGSDQPRTIVEGFIDSNSVEICSQSNKLPMDFSKFTIFNFDMSEESADYTISDFQQGKDIPLKLYTKELSNFIGLQSNNANDTIFGTKTQTTDTLWTFDNFSNAQWSVYPEWPTSDANLSLSSNIMPGAIVTMKLKIDGYGRRRSDNTVLDNIGNFVCRLDLLNNDVSYTYLNRQYYTAADWGKCVIEDEDGNVLYTDEHDITDGNQFFIPSRNFLRPAESYEVSRPRIITISLRMAPNIMKSGAIPTTVFNMLYNSNSNIWTFTGTIELLDAYTESTSLLSLRNFCIQPAATIDLWLDMCSVKSPQNVAYYAFSYPDKKYGTFANAYGYTETNNIIIPRKVIDA